MSIAVNSKKLAKGLLRATKGSLAKKLGHRVYGLKRRVADLRSGVSSTELHSLSRQRLVHLAQQSASDAFIYQVFELLFRLRNYKSATEVASILDVSRLNDVQALTVARAMLFSTKGVEGDRLIETRLNIRNLHSVDGRTALAFTDALYASGLDLERRIEALEQIERTFRGNDGINERARKHAKWTIFRLTANVDANIDVLKYAELEHLDISDPSYQLRYLPHLKTNGHDVELARLLETLGRHLPVYDPVRFVANLKIDPLWLNTKDLKAEEFAPSFFETLSVLRPISDQRAALPLFEELYQRSIVAQTRRYLRGSVFEKNSILRTFLTIGETDRILELAGASPDAPNTLLPMIIAKGMHFLINNDYLSARDSFLDVIEEDPSDGAAAQGLRLSLPRTGDRIDSILEIRARIGYGRDSKGRSGTRGGIGTDQTISLLMSGDYVAGQSSKRHVAHWRLLKSIYGDRFLNFEEIPLEHASASRLFVIGDDGVGDEIRTAQFYSQLADRFKEVVISCDPRLQCIFERSFPKIKFVPVWRFRRGLLDRQDKMQGRLTGVGEKLSHLLTEECRAHMEAADWITFGQNVFFNNFIDVLKRPEPGPYLQATDVRLPGSDRARSKLRIGILWRSHLRTSWRQFMYLKVEDFAPLVTMDDIELWSIQHSLDPEEKAFCVENGIKLIEGVDLFNDFEGLASCLKGMDHLIGISSVPIELGAALGVPVWMLGFSPENYFLRTGGGASEDDRLTLNSKIIAPEWIDFSSPRDECVKLVFQEVGRRLRQISPIAE